MPTLTATAEPTWARVRLEVDFSDTPAVEYIHVHRSLDSSPDHATDPVVRLHGQVLDVEDDFGTWPLVKLSDGRAVFYDTELPLDTAVWYRADTDQGTSTASADAGSVTVDSDDAIWLKDPIRPANDLAAVTPDTLADPACDPSGGIVVVGFEASQYASAAGLFPVEASPYPAVASRERKAQTASMVLVTRQLSDRDALRTLLSSGNPLLLQTPPSWGYGDIYVSPGDVTEARLARDHRVPWRQWTIPWVQVDRPGGLQYGVDGTRWLDLCDVFATWGAVEAAGKTWLDVLQGEVG